MEHNNCEQSANEARNETEETPQQERHHPRTQRARHNFWKVNAPTANQIMDKVKKVSRRKKTKQRPDPTVIPQQKDGNRQRKEAVKQVNNLVSLLSKETCGQVEVEKPDDVFRLLFENVNSLGVFATGEARGSKLR